MLYSATISITWLGIFTYQFILPVKAIKIQSGLLKYSPILYSSSLNDLCIALTKIQYRFSVKKIKHVFILGESF